VFTLFYVLLSQAVGKKKILLDVKNLICKSNAAIVIARFTYFLNGNYTLRFCVVVVSGFSIT